MNNWTAPFSFSNLTELITKGSSPKWQGINCVSKENGILFITSQNVWNHHMRKIDALKYVNGRFNEIEPRSFLNRSDILMNLVSASIGRTAVYDLENGAIINQAVALIRLLQFDGVDTRYLLHFFNSPQAIESMLTFRVTTALPNISLTNAREFILPLPPLAEQRRIVAKVDQLITYVDQLESQIDQSHSTAESLKESVVAEMTVGK